MKKLKNITVCTEKKNYYPILVESCKRNNIELITLGLGLKWTGFTMRFKLWYEYLDKLNDNEIVMLTDAYDVVILESSETIINKFKKFNKKIVFTTSNTFLSHLIFGSCLNKYVTFNPGSFIGYVKEIKILIKLILKHKSYFKKLNYDDQIILNNVCNSEIDFFKNNCVGDTKKSIFVDINSDYNQHFSSKYFFNYDLNYLKMKNNKLYYKDKNFSVLHFTSAINGSKYLKYLGYNTRNLNLKLNNYKIKQNIYFFRVILGKSIILIKFILILLLLYYSILKKNT
jgi:hypothetical protein